MENPLRLPLLAGLLAGLVLAAPGLSAPAMAQAAQEQAKTAPTETRSTHDDWIVRCKNDKAGTHCEAVQTLQAPDMKRIYAHIAVRAEKDGPVRLIILTPPGVWLPTNVVFKVPDVQPITLTYKRCGEYCVASIALSKEQVDELKASKGSGEFQFEDGSRNPIILPVSFKGLGAAMEATAKNLEK